jgi:hypothetical protein
MEEGPPFDLNFGKCFDTVGFPRNSLCFLTDDCQLSILSEISVANDIEGASLIREMILEFNESYGFNQIVIGMVLNASF